MNTFKIFCLDNSELADFEAQSKGYRTDLFVFVNDEYYSIYVYDIVRLSQDFEREVKNSGFFDIEPNIILVKKVEKSFVKFTVRMLIETGYFKKIKPMDVPDVQKELLPFI